jgi:transcriptional regulator with XRE-family HTH domain
MTENDELLKYPNYLLTTYQLEIYRQLRLYMDKNKLKQKDVAQQLNFSDAYVSQILNGKFNFTLKKLIQLGIVIGKVPHLEFVESDEYWRREKAGTKYSTHEIVYNVTIGEEFYKVDREIHDKIRQMLTAASSTAGNQFVKKQNSAWI